MIRIAGTIIPGNAQVWLGLTRIYGIGRSLATRLCQEASINVQSHVDDLTEREIDLLRNAISQLCVEGDLRRKVALDIKQSIELNRYIGLRHKRRLPVRGQRTRTNAKTRKRGKRDN